MAVFTAHDSYRSTPKCHVPSCASHLQVADVIIDGFTKGSLGHHGFDMELVLERNPHLVYLDLSCFGHKGPLSHGHGFQQNANFATGVAGIEDEELLGCASPSPNRYAQVIMALFCFLCVFPLWGISFVACISRKE